MTWVQAHSTNLPNPDATPAVEQNSDEQNDQIRIKIPEFRLHFLQNQLQIDLHSTISI